MATSPHDRRPVGPCRPCAPVKRAGLAAAAALACAALAGCVVLPVTVELYDPDCRIVTRQMVLQPVQIGAFHSCANEGCAMLLAAAGATAAVSAVVSGSIVVAGNVAYWFEKKGRCQPPAGPAQAPSAPAPAPAAAP